MTENTEQTTNEEHSPDTNTPEPQEAKPLSKGAQFRQRLHEAEEQAEASTSALNALRRQNIAKTMLRIDSRARTDVLASLDDAQLAAFFTDTGELDHDKADQWVSDLLEQKPYLSAARELDEARERIGHEKNIPANVLRGDTVEEIEAHAEAIYKLMHPAPKLPRINDPAKQPEGGRPQTFSSYFDTSGYN